MTFSWGEWSFDQATWRLSRSGTEVDLAPKAVALLIVLLERAPGLVTKDEILAKVWAGAHVEEGTIAYHVNLLRRNLDASQAESCIQTVRTKGYRFAAPLRRTAPTQSSTPTPSPATSEDEGASPLRRRSFTVMLLVGLLLVGLGVWTTQWTAVDQVTIAVAPFLGSVAESVAGTAGYEFAGAVATALAEVAGVTVLPPSLFDDGGEPFAATAQAGADLVMTGTVEETDGVRTVTVALFRSRDRIRLWASTIRRSVADGNTGNTLAASVAVQVMRQITATGLTSFPESPTPSRAAYELYVKAQEQWRRRTPQAVRQSIELYEAAIALDPQFALAYAGLADCYNLTVSGLLATDRYPKARRNAELALTLDPDSAEASTSIAFLRYKFERRWADSEAAFRTAIRLDADYALAHHWYGEMLRYMGRIDEAISRLETAIALEPRSLAIKSDLISALLAANRIDDAERVLGEAMVIDPLWFFIPVRQAQILAARGREAESVELNLKALSLRGVAAPDIDQLRQAYQRAGMQGYHRANINLMLPDALAPRAPDFGTATLLSLEYADICDKDEALRWFRVAIAQLEDAPLFLLQGRYDCLAGDPRLEALIDELHLRDAWDRWQERRRASAK